MHGTLLYPHPAHPRLAGPKGRLQGIPRNPELPPDLRKRISMWKRIVLAELLRRAGIQSR
ncbi:MAG: hypothetical protein WA188_03150 [Terriglobales bacterium]